MKVFIPIGVLVILLLIFIWPGNSQIKALYVVDVTEQVIVTRFGEVRSVKTSPGLNNHESDTDEMHNSKPPVTNP